jgi:hypothetical protein
MKLIGLLAAVMVLAYVFFGGAEELIAEELTIVATKESCKKLVKHKPLKGVAFTPGVDVRGRPVASADLPNNGGLAAMLPKTYEFPISVSPLKGTSATRFGETRLNLGQIGFDLKTGAVTYNGRPLDGVARRDFVKKCRDLLRN